MATLFLERPGGRIAYDDQGSGPLVLCAPSLGDVRGEYRFLTPLLVQAGYRVATMDVRGHGESSTGWPDYSVAAVGDDMAALIRHLDGGPAAIVGTSMAAGAAVCAAAAAPELAAALALVGPFVHGETSAAANLLYTALFARPWGPAAWQWYYSTLYPSGKPADFAEYSAALRANLAEPGRMEALMAMLRASKAASEARLGDVKAPVLVIMGSKDPDFKDPAAEAAWVAGQLRGEMAMLPGLGHYPHAEAPEAMSAALLGFLRTHHPARAETHTASPRAAQ